MAKATVNGKNLAPAKSCVVLAAAAAAAVVVVVVVDSQSGSKEHEVLYTAGTANTWYLCWTTENPA